MLQSHYADLSLAVNNDLVAFGSYLVECKFAEQSKVTVIVSNKDTTKLLEIVDKHFKTSTQGQSARAFFDKFVLILANKMKCIDIAQSLVTTYSKSCLEIGIDRAICLSFSKSPLATSVIILLLFIYLLLVCTAYIDMCIINVYIIALFTLRIQSPHLCESIGRDRHLLLCRESNQVRILVQNL